LLTLKAEPARQLVDNAYLRWTWSVLRAVFVLKARPSWVNLKRHEWKRLRGFTVRVVFNQTNKQTNKQTNESHKRDPECGKETQCSDVKLPARLTDRQTGRQAGRVFDDSAESWDLA